MKERRYGEVPVGAVFFAACDANYFKKFAPAFVSSIGANSSTNIHIHVINPDDEVFALACYLNSRVSQHVTYTFEDRDLSQYSDEQKRALYASLRFLIAPFILSHADQLLILDIDCLVMKTFDFPAYPVGYFPREPLPGTVGWEAEGTKCAAGCVFLDKSALNVANAISETLGGLELRWFNDQIALNHVMNQVPKDFVHKFDGEFMDWEFKEGTAIWTGKGPRKYENAKYVEMQNKYTDSIMNHDLETYENKVILAPRLDIPFKQFDFVRAGSVNEPIRKHWQNFIDQKVKKGYYKVSSPRWMFNQKIEKYFPNAEILVPHVERHNWGGGLRTKFYMQTVFPWLFTVDPLGWAGGAQYIATFDETAEYDETAYKELQNYIKTSSKFQHLQSNATDWSKIEKDNYLIVPLQLPHDETIKYHSDFSVEHFVRQICEWAKVEAPADCPQIVFKGHPINLKSMEPLKAIIEEYTDETDAVIYIDQGNFQELVRESQGMLVLNGGSGQEAMLMEKPVVCFGRCDYSPAVIQGDIEDVDAAYQQMVFDDMEERVDMYKRWFDWYDKITYNTKT
jgi:hypothetical protein